MESLNAILLEPPLNADEPFTFDDYSVKQDTVCLPSAPPAFEWRLPEEFDHTGKKKFGTVEEARQNAELLHRVKLG